jgi:hypothetical protein
LLPAVGEGDEVRVHKRRGRVFLVRRCWLPP